MARSIPPIREALESTGRPYVLENVADAAWDMRDPVTLCGCMFDLSTIDDDGVRIHLKRPRLFETNWPLTAPRPCDHADIEAVGRRLRGSPPRQARGPPRPQGRIRATEQGRREGAPRHQARHDMERPLRVAAPRLHRVDRHQLAAHLSTEAAA